MNLRRLIPSPAMGVALLALVVAVGGTAVAATKIGTSQIKNEAVTKKKIKKKAVSTNRLNAKAVTNGKLGPEAVKSGKIAPGAVTGSKVADDTLSDSKISDYEVLGGSFLQVTATDGTPIAAARAAAPEHSLYKKGPLELYAKCFRDTVTDNLRGEIYVRTSQDFSIMEGTDDLEGGPLASDYLNTSTAEVDRQVDTESETGPATDYAEDEGLAGAPDGTALHILTGIGIKNGPVLSDGPYGPGNACIFHGAAMG